MMMMYELKMDELEVMRDEFNLKTKEEFEVYDMLVEQMRRPNNEIEFEYNNWGVNSNQETTIDEFINEALEKMINHKSLTNFEKRTYTNKFEELYHFHETMVNEFIYKEYWKGGKTPGWLRDIFNTFWKIHDRKYDLKTIIMLGKSLKALNTWKKTRNN